MMKSIKILPIVGLTTLTIAGIGITENTSALDAAWGPDRPTFTWQKPSSYRTFNSITDNPEIGDERNFVRVREYGLSSPHLDNVDVYGGKIYEVYVYYHNNAGANYNESGTGIADNVRLTMAIPADLNAGDTGVIKGTISSTNTNPGSVWDTAFFNAKEKVHLSYVPDTTVIHNGGSANGQYLDSNAMFGNEGVKLAYWNDAWGIIPGCNEYAGYVTFQIKATGENKPVPPTPDPDNPVTPDNPSTPSELPNTGPAEVIAAVVIIVAIIAGGFYWYTTRKHLQKTTRAAAASRSRSTKRKPATRKKTTTRRSPVKRSAVKRAQRKRAVKKVVRKRK